MGEILGRKRNKSSSKLSQTYNNLNIVSSLTSQQNSLFALWKYRIIFENVAESCLEAWVWQTTPLKPNGAWAGPFFDFINGFRVGFPSSMGSAFPSSIGSATFVSMNGPFAAKQFVLVRSSSFSSPSVAKHAVPEGCGQITIWTGLAPNTRSFVLRPLLRSQKFSLCSLVSYVWLKSGK